MENQNTSFSLIARTNGVTLRLYVHVEFQFSPVCTNKISNDATLKWTSFVKISKLKKKLDYIFFYSSLFNQYDRLLKSVLAQETVKITYQQRKLTQVVISLFSIMKQLKINENNSNVLAVLRLTIAKTSYLRNDFINLYFINKRVQ